MLPERYANIVYGSILILYIYAALATAQPPRCRSNEERRICGPNCPMTCDLLDTNVCCDYVCKAGCFCRDGFIRIDGSRNAPCIPLRQCPKPGTVQFSTRSLIVPEDISVIPITVKRTDGTKGRITVNWRARNGTASAFKDFLAHGGVIVFADGQTEASIEINIIDDEIREPTESFSLELYDPSNKVMIGRNRTITITILDNDEKPGFLAFESNRIKVPEDVGKTQVIIIRTEGTDGRVTVLWSTDNGTAWSGLDFEDGRGIIVFEEGESRKAIGLTIFDDAIFESDEDFSVKLFNPSDGAKLGSRPTADIIIFDNDRKPGILQFRVSQSTVNESTSIVRVTVIRVEGSDGTVRVKFRSVDKTAVRNIDYEPVSGELEFLDGVTEQVIQVRIIDDSDREEEEDFTLQLFDPSGGATLGMRKIHTITIIDNDSKPGILQFQKTSITVSEKSGVASLIVVRNGGSDGEVSVRWQTQDFTAEMGKDYIESAGILVFGDGLTEKVLQIPILDDSMEEPLESFLVELFEPLGGVLIGTNNRATVFIEDDDEKPSVIQFKRRRGSVRENAGKIRIPVRRSVNFKKEVSVRWRTVERTARAGIDFVNGRGTLTFAIGVSERHIEIEIIDDRIQEANTLFDVILSQPSPGAVLGVISRFTVEILDDDEDPPQFSFENTHLVVSEGDRQARLVVVRTGAMRPATVRLRTIDQTAIGGIHFESANNELRFAQDQTENTVFIRIFDDSVVNRPRMFLAELFSPSSGGVILDGKATVVIEDNDDQFVQEDVTVTLPTTTTTTVAVPNDPSSIGCPSGQILKECAMTCPLSCDSLQFKISCGNTNLKLQCVRGCFCPPGLVLASQSGGECIPPSDCFKDVSTVVTNRLSFRDIDIRVKESAGQVLLTVIRSGTVGTLICFWRIIDVTTIINVHYRITTKINKLILAPTDLESDIRIEIINNNVLNPPRIFKVELFSIFGTNPFSFIPGRNVATVTIEDDDLVIPPLTPTRPPVEIPDIIVRGCPPGLILKECARACPPTCDDWQLQKSCGISGIGRFPCVRGCFCPPGFLLNRLNGTKCVRPSECGCPPSMIKATCKPACILSCAQLVCPRQHTLIPTLFNVAQSACSHNCVCPDDMVLERRDGNKCVTRSRCIFGK